MEDASGDGGSSGDDETGLTAAQVRHAREVFSTLIDKDGDGIATARELKRLFKGQYYYFFFLGGCGENGWRLPEWHWFRCLCQSWCVESPPSLVSSRPCRVGHGLF